ncbi:hypothetical protein Tco_1556444 [Tanacetum coccineum]
MGVSVDHLSDGLKLEIVSSLAQRSFMRQPRRLFKSRAYVNLSEELDGVHDTFHVSNLKKCLADPTLQVPLDEIQVDAKLNFVEEPMEILEREFKKLKRSRLPSSPSRRIQNVVLDSRGNVKIR